MLLGSVINYLLSDDKIHHKYVRHFTNAAYLMGDDFNFKDGLFSGYDADKPQYDRDTWDYQIGEDGYVKADDTMAISRCVLHLMKQHYSRYTPEVVSNVCGTPPEDFLEVATMIGETSGPNKVMTIMYALGWTQHTTGSQNERLHQPGVQPAGGCPLRAEGP
jgi:anaerobic selenocysteine-containing dehydrogenase